MTTDFKLFTIDYYARGHEHVRTDVYIGDAAGAETCAEARARELELPAHDATVTEVDHVWGPGTRDVLHPAEGTIGVLDASGCSVLGDVPGPASKLAQAVETASALVCHIWPDEETVRIVRRSPTGPVVLATVVRHFPAEALAPFVGPMGDPARPARMGTRYVPRVTYTAAGLAELLRGGAS